MKRTNRLILVIGVLLAVVAFVGVFFLLNQKGGGQGPNNAPQANVVVARRDIKLGEAIQENQVEQKQIPLSDKKPEYIEQTGYVVGQVARTNIAKGAYLTTTMFSGSGQVSLSKDLPAGMVAMPVRVDAVTGVGTLILPGDHVDVVATLPLKFVPDPPVPDGFDFAASPRPGQGGTWMLYQDPMMTSKVVLQDVEVRAVLGATATASTGTTGDLASASQVVILGLTTQQAEVLESVGQIAMTKAGSTQGALYNVTLVLRSPKDNGAPPAETSGIVLQTLIDKYGVLPPIPFEAESTPRP